MSRYHTLVYYLTIAPRLWRLRKLLPFAKIEPAGSRWVCDPPVVHTDVDFLIYGPVDAVKSTLIIYGYRESDRDQYGTKQYPGLDSFECYRKGAVNLIVTDSQHYYETFSTATHIAKRFGITIKYNRVHLHEALRLGELPSETVLWSLNDHPGIEELLKTLTGPHGKTMLKAYRIQHGLD